MPANYAKKVVGPWTLTTNLATVTAHDSRNGWKHTVSVDRVPFSAEKPVYAISGRPMYRSAPWSQVPDYVKDEARKLVNRLAEQR